MKIKINVLNVGGRIVVMGDTGQTQEGNFEEIDEIRSNLKEHYRLHERDSSPLSIITTEIDIDL